KDWQAAEANRKAALAKWQADQQAKRKASAAQAAKKAPTTAPAPTTQVAGRQPTTKPATSQKVAKAPPQPPKALATPRAEPKFAPLAKPAEKPAPKPQPKRKLWDEEQLKSADAFAVETAAVSKRLQELHGQTGAAAKQAKQWQDRQSALDKQINQQDGALAKRQQGLRKPASELVSKAGKLGAAFKKLVEANNPVPSMQAAAQAIAKHELSTAPKAQMTSAERLEALAKALQGEAAKATASAEAAAKAAAEARREAAAQQELAKQAGQFQKQQAQLRKQAKALAKRLAPLGANLQEKIVSDLARQQAELAKEATELSDELARPQQAEGVEMPAQPDPVAQAAAMEARKTGEALKAMSAAGQTPAKPGQDTPVPAEEVLGLQAKVARQLDRLVERLQEPVAEDPARWEAQAMEDYVRIQHAERAAELAARQRRLSRQLARTVAGKPMQAVAIEQAALGRKVRDFAQAAEFLAEQVEIMEPKMEAMKPKMLANAQKATELLAKTAPTAMDTAANELREDHASQAVKPMGEARKAVADAHRLLGTLQGQMAKAASEAPAGDPSDEERSRRLTESLQDQYEALRRMLEAQEASANASTDPMEAAAQAAARAMRDRLAARAARAAANANAARMQASAREFLEAAWEAAGEKNIDPENAVIVPGMPMGGGNWRFVIPDSKILDLELIGLTRSDWARLPWALREEVIQATEEKAPAEYREVIKRYFKAISQRAGTGWDKPLLVDTPKTDEPTKQESKAGKK
ncbi:MAG: coiled-coil domain-containing protein, partial [Planctomycetota bacterium]